MSAPARRHRTILTIALLFFAGGWLQSALALSLPDNSDPFADIQRISMTELHDNLDKYLVVDVRTRYEYELLHIKGAVNIPFHEASFQRLLRETAKSHGKAIVFYCNGSHETALKASRAANIRRLKHIQALEASPLQWARTYPEQSVLRGKSPLKSTDLISDKEFAKHTIDAMDFENRTKQNVNVLDVRAYQDREGISIFVGIDKWIPLEKEKRLKRALGKMLANGKPLLVYDDRSVRTRWLQYTLKEMGFKEYYFMRGGVKAYSKMISSMHKGQWDHGQFNDDKKTANKEHAGHQMAQGHNSGHSKQHQH